MKLLPFNDFDLKTPRILEALNEASRSLAELKGFANSIPNQHILINAITINEAKDSSEIENIVTTHDSIYKVLTESGYKDESAKEVVDYRSAIWRGYEIIKEKGFISTNVLVELQGMIEHNKAGVRKNPGTKLVNSKTGEVIYTPPQEEKEIRDLLKNLEDYINKNKDQYYKLFTEFRENNNYEDWIIYTLKGIEETSKNTIELIKLIQGEMESYKEEFLTKLPKIYSDELLDSLFFEVYTRINYIEDRCGVTRQTAATYLNSLVDAGLLEFEKVGRESIYKNTRLIDLLSNF